ncbi:MAG: hypothetical protein IJ550_05625 [Bacteroidaceae bacterium]|nr:hypothetical protein [Bacteroidaceae bacterium]
MKKQNSRRNESGGKHKELCHEDEQVLLYISHWWQEHPPHDQHRCNDECRCC